MDASTTTKSRYLQPAALGGVVTGVLSALPFIKGFNSCCCLWVVCGALVAAYLLQQNSSAPIAPADGALAGLLAGIIGIIIGTLLSIPIDLAVGPLQQRMLQNVIDSSDAMSPEIREVLQRFVEPGDAPLAARIMARVIGFGIFLFVGSIFSMLGGLLGAVIFSKRVSPAVSDGPAS